jgi:hypothetical protein
MTAEEIKNLFTYHPPRPDQVPRYEEIRTAAQAFAVIVNGLTPDSLEKATAIGKIQEAVMWANASIALEQNAGRVARKG